MLSFKDTQFDIIEKNENMIIQGNLPLILLNYLKTNNLDLNNLQSKTNYVSGQLRIDCSYEWKYIKINSNEDLQFICNKVKNYYESSYFIVLKDSKIYHCFWALRNDSLNKTNVSLFISGVIVGLIAYNYIPHDKTDLMKLFNFNENDDINIDTIQEKVTQMYDKMNYFNEMLNKSKNKSKI